MQSIRSLEDVARHRFERRRIDRIEANHETLVKIDEMGGCVPGRADAVADERRVDHRRHGPLAVGASDMHRRKAPLGIAERGAEMCDVGEPELDAERLEREQPLDCGQFCRSGSTAPATASVSASTGAGCERMKRNARERALFSSRRSITRSIIP